MLTDNKHRNQLQIVLNLPTCRNIALTVAAFLSEQDIQALCEAFLEQKEPHFLVQLFRNMNFINKYINATDKSLYFTFYEEQQYRKIEIEQIAAISRNEANLFLRYELAFAEVTNTLKEKVPVIQQELSGLREMIVNPDLPLPKLKRQTQGMFCTSPFQLFLVDSTFNEEQDNECFTIFQNLQEFLSLDKEQDYLKQFMMILKDKIKNGDQLKKIIQVRYTPYEINFTNFKDFLLEGNQLHNFIVGLFALTDVMLEATYEYVRMITDPLHRLVQLTLRYNIYRNYVLAVEEMLPFVFRIYDNIYRQTIEESHSKPKYNFWRPAMTKWFLRMNHLHTEGQEVYMHCLIKLCCNKLKQQLSQQCGVDQKKYGRLLSLIQMSNYQYELSEQVSKLGNGSSQILSFFDSHVDNYEIIVMEFNDYLVDISVNEQTVHWCGHSDHQLEQPYLDYETAAVKSTLDFISSFKGSGKPLEKQQLSQLAKIDTQYLSTLQIKNRTLKKIIEAINVQYGLENQLSLQGEFEENDGKLEYFNHKAMILAVVDEKARAFYSIPPHYSPEKLIDMIDTNDSSNNNSESEQVYESDSQEEERPVKSQKPGKRQFAQIDSDEEERSIQLQKKAGKKEIKSNKIFFDEQEETGSSLAQSLESSTQPN